MSKKYSETLIICLYVTVTLTSCSRNELTEKNYNGSEKIGTLFKRLGVQNDNLDHITKTDSRKRFALRDQGNRLRTLVHLNQPSVIEPKNNTLTIAIILPHTNFGVREYKRVTNAAINNLHRGRGQRFEFLKKYQFGSEQVKSTMMTLTPSPTGRTSKNFSLQMSFKKFLT